MIDIKEGRATPRPVRLDWRAYWKEFSRAHGDFPQLSHGRLLFRDGWTYATSYEGPEWPPPRDEEKLRDLVAEYWRLRRAEVRDAWWRAKAELDYLSNLQREKSAPLQRSVAVTGEDGKLVRVSEGVELGDLEATVDYLKAQLDECERIIRGDGPEPSLLETSTHDDD